MEPHVQSWLTILVALLIFTCQKLNVVGPYLDGLVADLGLGRQLLGIIGAVASIGAFLLTLIMAMHPRSDSSDDNEESLASMRMEDWEDKAAKKPL